MQQLSSDIAMRRKAHRRRTAIILAVITIYALIFVVVNLLIDLSYAWIDPRIRFN